MRRYKNFIAAVLACGLALNCFSACSGPSHDISGSTTESTSEGTLREKDIRSLSANEYTQLNLSGTDALGRTFETADSENKDVYVGMFFYLTLGNHANHNGIYDVSAITGYGKNMEAFFKANDTTSPVGSAHFWGEPVWGYYRSDDEWVIRKQIEMLTMAGVDFLCFDTTNAVLYLDTVDIILRVLSEYAAAGWDVPKFMFYIAASDKNCIKTVYEKYYSKGLYKELWFAPKGKPMITQMYSTEWNEADPTEAAISGFFEFRFRQWPTDSFLRKGWSWIEFEYPQPIHTDMVSVSSAQHTSLKFSSMSDNRGKGFDLSTMTNDASKVAEGANYQSQWNRAISGENSDRIEFILLTQWNEWVAEKFWDETKGEAYMVDGFNQEYNRDLEPVKNGYGDNYYMQTIQNIRTWKYSKAKHYAYEKKTVDISKFEAEAWEHAAVYLDFTGECIPRNHAAFDSSFNYIDESNRNDIASVSVLHDDTYVYFRVETKEEISKYQNGDTGWMNILVGSGEERENTFMSYGYAINRRVNGNETSVCRYNSDGEWKEVGTGTVYVSGNVMQVKVKLSDLGMSGKDFYMRLKVTDNVKKPKSPLSYFTSGDSAPIGRLSYSYGY